MPFRTLTTSGPNPNPTLLTKYSPAARPASKVAVWAVTSRCTARIGLCRYTPVSFAKSFPVPIGTTPSAVSPPCSSRPLATSCTVPSPPRATTQSAPARAACDASSAPWPGHWVRVTSTAHPWRRNSRATGSRARAAAPRPAAGFNTTWAWIRSPIIKPRGPIRCRIGPRPSILMKEGLRHGRRVPTAGGELDRDVARRAVLGDGDDQRPRVEPGIHGAAGVEMQWLAGRGRERIAERAGRPGRATRDAPSAARERRADLDRPRLVGREERRPFTDVGRRGARGEGVVSLERVGQRDLVGAPRHPTDSVLHRRARLARRGGGERA